MTLRKFYLIYDEHLLASGYKKKKESDALLDAL